MKKKIILIVMILIIVISSIATIVLIVGSKNNLNNNSLTPKETTGFYVVDYDYDSLEEGGDGSDIKLHHSYLGDYYELDEMPSAYWEDEKVTIDEIKNKEFSESNPRYSFPFIDSSDDYILYNIDGKSTVSEAYDKGWYAITDLDISNFTTDYDYNDQYASFDAIIKGLGKPYCVIKSVQNTFSDNDEYTYNTIFIIYEYNNAFYVLEYYDNSNGVTENIDMLSSYWIASEEMLKAYITNNMGSNDVESYTQSYIFQNGKNLIN